MEAYEAIMTRRSIRAYAPQPVPEALARELLAAGMNAPSAGDQQPWHFVAVRERKILDALAGALPYGKMLKQAPLGVVVCGDPGLEQVKDYWVQDCSAATQNVLLAAHAKGLGAVWIGVHPREERVRSVRAVLGIPERIVPLCVVAVGYPGEPAHPVNRYREDRVHGDRW
jgi:nitroreductase